MKRILTSIACLLTLAACSKSPEEQTIERSLKATPATLEFDASDTAVREVVVTTENTDWTNNQPAAWLKTVREGNTLKVSVTANEGDDREATLRISATDAGVAPVEVKVTQKGTELLPDEEKQPALAISTDTLTFTDVDAEPQVVNVTAEGGVVWKAQCDTPWIILEASGSTLTVSVLDNDDSLDRSGTISVYNDNDALNVLPLTIAVKQDALAVEPSIRIEGLPEDNNLVCRHFEDNTLSYNTTGRLQVFIEPKSASFAVAEVDLPSYTTITQSGSNGDYLSIIFDTKKLTPEAFDGSFTVYHSNMEVEPIHVTLHKNPMEYFNYESTLENDVNDMVATKADVQITTYSDSYPQQYSRIDMAFFTDDVQYDRGGYVRDSDNMVYRYKGAGEIVLIELYGDKHLTDITLGTYTVDPSISAGDPDRNAEAGMAAPGKFVRFTKRIELRGCAYALIDNNIEEDKAFAVVKNGTVTVDKVGDEYTITWNFGTDSGHSVTGSYSGPVDLKLSHQSRPGDFGEGGPLL